MVHDLEQHALMKYEFRERDSTCCYQAVTISRLVHSAADVPRFRKSVVYDTTANRAVGLLLSTDVVTTETLAAILPSTS